MEQVEYLEPSLAQVIERIGPQYVTVVEAPHGVDVPVSGPAILDPVLDEAPRPGTLVLLVGLTAGSPDAEATLHGLTGAAAAVVRAGVADAKRLAPAARAAGIALVALHTQMPWSLLHTMVEDAVLLGDSLISAPGLLEAPGRDLGSVPLGDLNALVNVIAETFDRPVGILDTEWRLLAYSAVPGQVNDELQRQVILTKSVPASNAPRETRRLLLTTQQALRFHTGEPFDNPEQRVWRIGVGIRSGPEPLGMLWILEGHERLPEERLVLAEEFARLAGAHLLRARTARDADRERRGRLVGDALDGDAAACRRLGLPRTGLAVLAITSQGQPEHLLDAVATYLDAYRRSAACVLRDHTVYCLLPAPDLRTARDTAADLAGRLAPRHRLTAAVGSLATADTLTVSLRHADLVLTVLRSSGARVATIDEVRPAAALIELQSLLSAHPDLLLHTFTPPAGEETVTAWLEAHGDIRAAAATLAVHPNTLRYRLRRLESSGYDLSTPDARLTTWLRLRLTQPHP
ncbi:PucR family transcriptional regulator [Nonomuraea sp. NPDC050540]|uniref:PucR family transcriptional regulator n=1 Tax=Nonomuraea sp. NPDC050540 TaxID=3364367 RepID=UPI003798D67C